MFLNILQIITAILLIIVILLQSKGSGMGAAFGGDSNVYSTKRGAEKFLSNFTIVLAVIFLTLTLLDVIY